MYSFYDMMEMGGTNNPGFQALPDFVQAKILSNMGYGGQPPMMPSYEEGGEPNGGMALGQMAAVADKMNKLRQFVSAEQNLDPWIASKLAVMDDSAEAIANYMMYNPEAQGEGQEMEEQGEENEQEEMMANGGYVVTRSNDRKGKTHKVTGPDGTVKYFGDSKLGQHPKDPERKKAFYARHKKNLENNPFFRAFARKTWKEGGSTFSGNAFYQDGGEEVNYEPNWFAKRTSFPGQVAGAVVNFLPWLGNHMYSIGKEMSSDFNGESKKWQHPEDASTSQTIDQYMINRKYGNAPKDLIYEKAIKNLTPEQRKKLSIFADGGIHLDPSKRGTFKAQATRMGMGVQEAASAILNAPEGKYSPAMRKKANFAKNFAKQVGGPVEGEVIDVSPEQLELLRQQGYQFEIM